MIPSEEDIVHPPSPTAINLDNSGDQVTAFQARVDAPVTETLDQVAPSELYIALLVPVLPTATTLDKVEDQANPLQVPLSAAVAVTKLVPLVEYPA